jgi:hypothetical protein
MARMNFIAISDFLRGSAELDCPKVELKRSRQEEHAKTIEGPGSISLDSDGTFKLKVYLLQLLDFEEIFEHLKWDAGKLIPDDGYYDLIAHEISGGIWTAERILIDRSVGVNGSLLLAKIPELKKQEESPVKYDKAMIYFYFNRLIRVPFNTVVSSQELVGDRVRSRSMGIRLAKFEAAKIKFEIEEVQGNTRLVAIFNDCEPIEFMINRIHESFCFVTANSYSWSCLVIKTGAFVETRIRALQPIQVESRILPPISFKAIDPTNSWWHLFDCYLTNALDNDADYFHPLSSAVFSVIESGRASLDTEALTLSTSIEAILKEQMADLFKPPASLSKNIRIAQDIIKASLDLDNAFQRRLEGAFGSMKKLRANDILHNLKNHGLIDDALVDIYGPIRNGSAHGDKMSGGDLQDYINKLHSVLVLFYHLVFLSIKYEGPYSDYSAYGFPEKTFSRSLAIIGEEQS